MSILAQQNMLQNPALADAPRRPGGVAGSAALYSFAHDYVAAEGVAYTSSYFTLPSTYAFDEATMDVTKTPPPTTEGVDGENILPDQTTYGTAGFNQLPDTQQTNLGAVAEVIGGNEEVEGATLPTDTLANESTFNEEVVAGTGELIASGAPTLGHDAENKYDIDKNAAADGHGSGGYPQQMPSDDLPAEAAEVQDDSPPASTTKKVDGHGSGGYPEVSKKVVTVAPLTKLTGTHPREEKGSSNAYPPTALDGAGKKGTTAKKGLDYY